MVPLLLPRRQMLGRIALVGVLLVAAPAAFAAERTFVFSPAGLADTVDGFNAQLIANSGSPLFGKQVRLHGGSVRFFGRSCSTLGAAGAVASRVRVLDGATRAGQLARHTPNLPLAAALQSLGAASWTSPASARTHQPSWTVEAPPPGVVGFTTAGFATGDPTGAIGASTDRTPSFLVKVDLTSGVTTTDPVPLVLALTTEVPSTHPGRIPKRSECFLLGASRPTDVQALADLVAATTLPALTRSRLDNILADATNWIAAGKPLRAARAAKHFALEVASRSGSEIPAEDAEAMIARALQVMDALSL